MSRYYTDEFKQKIVELKQSGKFGIKEDLSESEKELRVLRKENKQLKMEVDILKQAALILARKPE